MPFVSGYLNVTERGHPGHDLPGGGQEPVDPGFGQGHPLPPMGGTLPEPPPGVWPPPSMGAPIVPVDPGFGGGIPVPPGTIWPPVGRPPHIDAGPADPAGRPPQVGGGPAQPPGRPPQVGGGPATPPGLPGHALPSRVFWMLCYTPTLGWKFVAVDPSLSVGMPLPPAPAPK